MTKTVRTIDEVPVGIIYKIDEITGCRVWLKAHSNYIVGGLLTTYDIFKSEVRVLYHGADLHERPDFEVPLAIEELLYKKWNEYKLANNL